MRKQGSKAVPLPVHAALSNPAEKLPQNAKAPAGDAVILPLAATAAAAPLTFYPHPLLDDPFDLPKILLVQAMVFLASFLLWRVGWPRRRVSVAGAVFLSLAGLFLAWAWGSVAWTPDSYEGLTRVLHWTFCGAVIALVGLTPFSAHLRLFLFRGLFSGAMLVAIAGQIAWWAGKDIWGAAVPPAPTLGNINWAAEVVVIAVPAGVAVALLNQGSVGRWIAGLGLGGMTAFLFQTQCTAAWLAFAFQSVILTAFLAWQRIKGRSESGRPHLRPLAAGILVALLLIPITPEGWINPLAVLRRELAGKIEGIRIASTGTPAAATPLSWEQKSVTARSEMARHAWWIAQRHLWRGVGLGGFESAYSKIGLEGGPPPTPTSSRICNPHNDPLQILAELGLVGGGLSGAALLAFVALSGQALARTRHDPPKRLEVIAALLGLLGIFICSLFAFPFFTGAAPFLAALLVGVVISLMPTIDPGDTERLRPRPMRWAGLILAGLALLWLIWSTRVVAVSLQVRELQAAYRAQNYPQVLALKAALAGRDLGRRDYLPAAAEANFSLQHFDEAALLYESYLQTYPGNVDVVLSAARSHANRGRLEQAFALCDRALHLAPHLAEPWYARAQFHLAAQNLDQAIADMRTVVRLAPKNGPHLARLGLLLLHRGVGLPEAEKLLEQAIEYEPALGNDAEVRSALQRARAKP